MMSVIRVFLTNIRFISYVFLMNYHLFLPEIYLFMSSYFYVCNLKWQINHKLNFI